MGTNPNVIPNRANWPRLTWSVLIILFTIFVVAVALLTESKILPAITDLDHRGTLTKPIRLKVGYQGGFEEFLLGLRTYHYRARYQGTVFYSDIYYDTDNWDLFRHGYSYRFRKRNDAEGLTKSTVHIELEPRFVPKGTKKLELRNELPDSLGSAIANGAWDKAILEGKGLKAVDALHSVSEELGIRLQDLHPRLAGDLERKRFDITDKGQNWFELDHEIWRFRLFPDSQESNGITYEDLVLDTRLKKKDPELLRRVRTMTGFVTMLDGIRPVTRVPHERAVEALVGR